jgi:hypothetical protein
MARHCGIGKIVAAFALMLGSGAATAAPPLADDGVALEAVWKVQHLTFIYRGSGTIYTCHGLQDKLEKILRSVGAHDSLRLQAYACDEAIGMARVRIAMQSPVAAAPETVRALTTYDSQQQLTARVRNERLPNAEDIERFAAVWKTVSFARDRKMRLAPGDCELVRQVRRTILPLLSVRIVYEDSRCSSMSPPRLTVSALVAAATADGTTLDPR